MTSFLSNWQMAKPNRAVVTLAGDVHIGGFTDSWVSRTGDGYDIIYGVLRIDIFFVGRGWLQADCFISFFACCRHTHTHTLQTLLASAAALVVLLACATPSPCISILSFYAVCPVFFAHEDSDVDRHGSHQANIRPVTKQALVRFFSLDSILLFRFFFMPLSCAACCFAFPPLPTTKYVLSEYHFSFLFFFSCALKIIFGRSFLFPLFFFYCALFFVLHPPPLPQLTYLAFCFCVAFFCCSRWFFGWRRRLCHSLPSTTTRRCLCTR